MSIVTKKAKNKIAENASDESAGNTFDRAIACAKKRLETWQNKPYDERAAILHQLACKTRKGTDQLSQLVTREIDDLLAQAHHEISTI